jgi:hypothetical protein
MMQALNKPSIALAALLLFLWLGAVARDVQHQFVAYNGLDTVGLNALVSQAIDEAAKEEQQETNDWDILFDAYYDGRLEKSKSGGKHGQR